MLTTGCDHVNIVYYMLGHCTEDGVLIGEKNRREAFCGYCDATEQSPVYHTLLLG